MPGIRHHGAHGGTPARYRAHGAPRGQYGAPRGQYRAFGAFGGTIAPDRQRGRPRYPLRRPDIGGTTATRYGTGHTGARHAGPIDTGAPRGHYGHGMLDTGHTGHHGHAGPLPGARGHTTAGTTGHGTGQRNIG